MIANTTPDLDCVVGDQLEPNHGRRTRSRRQERPQSPDRRRLACAIGAQEAEHLPVADLERDVRECDPITEPLAQTASWTCRSSLKAAFS